MTLFVRASAAALVAAAAAALPAPAVDIASSFVTSPDGTRIHVLAAGKAGAPAVLFIPGWTMSAEIWRPQLERFAPEYRVVAMDPRGQGESDTPADGLFPAGRARDIKAVVDSLDLAPVVLVGWSMGVTEIGAYLDQYGSGTVRGLVLVDGIFGADWDPVVSPQMIRWAAAFQRDRATMTALSVRSWFRTPQSDAFLQRMTQESLKTPTDVAMATFVGTMGSDYRPQLATIDRPALLAVALPSPFAARYEEMKGAIPGVRYEVFENAGHALFVDQAQRFDAVLGDFLAQLAAAGTGAQ